jgi:hypothetical protein
MPDLPAPLYFPLEPYCEHFSVEPEARVSRSHRKQSVSPSRQTERKSKNRSERRNVKYALDQGKYELLPQSSPVPKPKGLQRD